MGSIQLLTFIHSFTNHLFLYVLSENMSCWGRDRKHLADSEHSTNMCQINAWKGRYILVYKVTISQRNK